MKSEVKLPTPPPEPPLKFPCLMQTDAGTIAMFPRWGNCHVLHVASLSAFSVGDAVYDACMSNWSVFHGSLTLSN